MCKLIPDYKQCEFYFERNSDLFNDPPGVTVIGCQVHGIKPLCVHSEVWKTCIVSRYDQSMRYRYRLKLRTIVNAQLRTPCERVHNYGLSDEEFLETLLLPKPVKHYVYIEEYYL